MFLEKRIADKLSRQYILIIILMIFDTMESSLPSTYTFQSESTLYSRLNLKELFVWIRCDIWSLSNSNGIQTHNHLVCNQALDH